MNRRRRRSPITVAAAGLICVIALAPLAASQSAPAAAAVTPPNPIQVTLTTFRPIAPQPGNTLVLDGTLRNVSDETISHIFYDLKISSSAIGTRGEFDSYADNPESAPTGFFEEPTNVIAADPSILAPGGSAPFHLSVDVDALGLGTIAQVRELAISVSGDTTVGVNQSIGHLRTFLPWDPRTGSGTVPLHVAWIWPLADRPHRSTPTTWFDDDLAGEIANSATDVGRLRALLDAGDAAERQQPYPGHPTVQPVPVTWALDPMLASDVQAMTVPYKVTTATGTTTTGTGTPDARTWLATLRGAVGQPNATVLALPYADPDVVATVRSGFPDATAAIGLATANGRTVLQRILGSGVDLPRYGWPPGGLANQRTVDALTASGDTTLVLADSLVPPVVPPTYTPPPHTTITTNDSQVDAVLTDSGLTNDVLDGQNNPDGSTLSLQQYLAETLMVNLEEPTIARSVVVAPSHHWSPTPTYAAQVLTDTGRVPWIHPVGLGAVASSPTNTSIDRQPPNYPASARRNELPQAYLERVNLAHREVAAFAAILPPADPMIVAYNDALQATLSSGWRNNLQLANSTLTTLTNNIKLAMRQVRIASHANSYVTLTSHGGKIPISISNDLATPVTVSLRVLPNQRLTLANHGVVSNIPIAAHQVVNVSVHASAKTSGVFPIRVQLLTPKGDQTYGLPVLLYLRSTVYGTITLIITGAATAALMIAVATRLTRRALAARRSDGVATR